MAERTWVAVILALVVWFGYIKWFAPPPPDARPKVAVESPTSPAKGEMEKTSSPVSPAASVASFTEPLKLEGNQEIKNGKLRVTFSSASGKISKISLEGYKESLQKDSPPVSPVSPEQSSYSLATLFSDPQLAAFGTAKYQVSQKIPQAIDMERSENGATLRKSVSFPEGSYLFDASYHLVVPKGDKTDWGYLMLPVGANDLKHDANDPLHHWEVVSYQNGSLKRENAEKLPEDNTVRQGDTAWLGFGNRYFTTVLINQSAINPDVVYVNKKGFSGAYLRYPLKVTGDKRDFTFQVKVFVGPKDYSELSKVPGLKGVIDYGMFSFLAFPLLWLLQFFYHFVYNYGIAIILLTIVVRALFYPLSLKSFKSMKSMQKLQPQIAALKEKYKDDKERLNREQLALFKTHKVNPAGGCLPMLVQLPVFIALYAVLGNSIELFHAPFFGWIRDLSTKDAFYVLPILMGISMVLQQKLTPSVGMDPMQQKMMMFMPIVFTFIMLNLPSGLTLYIFVSTLLGILQQMAMAKSGEAGTVAIGPKTSSS